MDALVNQINEATSSLTTSKQRLTVLETSTQTGVGTEVNKIHDALAGGEAILRHITSQAHTYLRQIKDIPDANVRVDLKPQVDWLRESLHEFTTLLRDAQSSSSHALQNTMQSSYSLLDIRQEVHSCSDLVSECRSTASQSASQARCALDSSEAILPQLQEAVSAKELNLSSATAEAQTAKQRLDEVQANIQGVQGRISQAEVERRRAQNQVDLSFFGWCAGILAAPVTGGASLLLCAASGVSIVVAGEEGNDLSRELHGLRSKEESLGQDVARCTLRATDLEEEKLSLEGSLRSLREQLSDQRAKQKSSQETLDDATRLQSELSALEGHLTATMSDVTEAEVKLQKIKHALDEISARIGDGSLQIENTYNDVVERTRGRRQSSKHREVVEDVVATLERVERDLPSLLTSIQGVKFLQAPLQGDPKYGAQHPQKAVQNIPGVVFYHL